MKFKLLLALLVLLPSAAFAKPPSFTYKTTCYLEENQTFSVDECTVVETREKGGALRTRNVYSNRFGLTIKSWFDSKQGFMTWDSHNKFNYKWEYKVGSVSGPETYTYVMPGFLIHGVSWD
jgi:hypothetical protein